MGKCCSGFENSLRRLFGCWAQPQCARRVGVAVVNRAGLRSLNELLQSPRALKALVAGGSVLGLVVLGLLAAPALVRGKVERAAEARGFEATVRSVGVGWGEIWLRGVEVTSPGDELEARLDAVGVSVFSGEVRASGERCEAREIQHGYCGSCAGARRLRGAAPRRRAT